MDIQARAEIQDASPPKSPLLVDWRPEDEAFWDSTGKRIASRNLWISIPALFLAFSVWMVWSTTAVRLNSVGFNFSTNELFWLTALPGLTGATLRIFYSFLIPIFGGRRFTALSTASLLLPMIWMSYAIRDPGTPYGVFVLIALMCGFGGANFSSSMANISFFYPKRLQGTALGLNAGLGNLGVSGMQFVVPLVITSGVFGALGGEPLLLADGKKLWLQNAGLVWVPLIAIVVVAAWYGMNDIAAAKASLHAQSVIFGRKHTWLISWLYLGSFGSFIGFAAGFPMLIKTQFPHVDALRFAFLGPLVGALSRPPGGWLSDKLGGATVTFWNFVVMMGAVGGVLYFLGPGYNFYGFLVMFMVLFITTGVGNGSIFRMVPVIFRAMHEKTADGKGQEIMQAAIKQANMESAAVLGFSSAVGAYGGFFIPKSFGTSMAMTGRPEAAFYGFLVFYLTCVVVTWLWYFRKGAEAPC